MVAYDVGRTYARYARRVGIGYGTSTVTTHLHVCHIAAMWRDERGSAHIAWERCVAGMAWDLLKGRRRDGKPDT